MVLGLATVAVFLGGGVASGPLDWGALLTGAAWNPSRDRFGGAAMLWGTLATGAVALAVAVPLGWAAAIGVAEVVPRRWRGRARAGVEILAAVPSIVYGLVGIAYVRPLVARAFDVPGGDSLLAAGLVLAVMVLPTVVAVSVDALAAVPAAVREAAAACGLRRSEVVRRVVVPAARRGMVAGGVLGLARALGETIAVYLLVGRADGRLPSSPGAALDALVRPGQTLTTKLNGPEALLAGTSGPHWAALCGLGILLLGLVAVLTVAARRIGGGTPAPRAGRGALPRAAVRARPARDRMATVVGVGAVALPLALVVAMAVAVVGRGSGGLDPRFWWSAPTGFGGGGVRDQVLGSVLLVGGAGSVAAPVGLGLGLVLGEHARGRLRGALDTLVMGLAGMPSILLGLWGYWLFSVRLGWGKSWLAGCLVLGLVAIPPVAVAVAAAARSLPPERREAALAAGLRTPQLVRTVVVPHAAPGLWTGLLLGLARAAGETAPILFTATVVAGAGAWPSGVVAAPVVSLPTHVFNLAQDAADPAALAAAWSSALVLVLLAGSLVVAAAAVRRRTASRWA